MFIEISNIEKNVRPRRGRISLLSFLFYTHVMPLASFRVFVRFSQTRRVCMFIEKQ